MNRIYNAPGDQLRAGTGDAVDVLLSNGPILRS